MSNQNSSNLDSYILNAILDHSRKFIAVIDCDFKYLAFSQAYFDGIKKFYGTQITLGMNLQDALVQLPVERAKEIANFSKALRGEAFTVTGEFGNPSLERNYYEVRYTPIYDNNKKLIGALQIANDYTYTKRAEENVKNLTNQLNLALEAAQIGSWHWNLVNNTVTFNERYRELFGLPNTDNIKVEVIFDRIHPSDLQRVFHEVNVSVTGKSFFETEFRVLLANQVIRWVTGLGQVYCDAKGNPSYMLGINLDITDKKQSEERLYTQQEQLANIAKLLSISETASNLAHELNQPLTAIATYAQLCTSQIENNKFDQQELLNHLKHIAKQSLRTGEIIHKIKEFTKHKSLSCELTSIDDLINETLEHITYLKRAYTLNIVLNLAQNIPLINIDKIHLQQVIINIILNALEAMPTDNDHDNQISIATALNNNYAEIFIKNNGAPINEETQKKIFDNYFTTKASGMGIGLSMCRTILEAHRGNLILLYSSKEKGTCFKLSLPIH